MKPGGPRPSLRLFVWRAIVRTRLCGQRKRLVGAGRSFVQAGRAIRMADSFAWQAVIGPFQFFLDIGPAGIERVRQGRACPLRERRGRGSASLQGGAEGQRLQPLLFGQCAGVPAWRQTLPGNPAGVPNTKNARRQGFAAQMELARRRGDAKPAERGGERPPIRGQIQQGGVSGPFGQRGREGLQQEDAAGPRLLRGRAGR